jgi:hypothetical protein
MRKERVNPNDQPFSHGREQTSRIDAVVAVRQAAHAARRVVIAAKRLRQALEKTLPGNNQPNQEKESSRELSR